MNRRAFHRLLLAGLLLVPAGAAWSQQRNLFVFGTIRWRDGPPAQGLEVRLMQGSEAVAAAFTDQEGYYAFYDQPGLPTDYTIAVFSARGKLVEVPILQMPPGGEVPITLE